MASLLEEVVKRKEKGEPCTKLNVEMPIQEAYCFEVAKDDAVRFFKECFTLEYEQCRAETRDIVEKMA
ncbi:hypothetical protein JXB28_01420, partial [Candidatus Woesearchaeota archaeon]|nr:hypothetical protein [Candidatus Woesearchaeota archaeon]